MLLNCEPIISLLDKAVPARTCPQKEAEQGGAEAKPPNSAFDLPYSPDFQCNVPLGMESGRIANEQISASSTYSDGRWTPQQSRLHGEDNGWTPNLDSNKEYLQVLPQTAEGMQSMCADGPAECPLTRTHKAHKENKHGTLENAIQSFIILTSMCTRHEKTVLGSVLCAGVNQGAGHGLSC